MTSIDRHDSLVAVADDDRLLDAFGDTAPRDAPAADDGTGGLLTALLTAWQRHDLDDGVLPVRGEDRLLP